MICRISQFRFVDRGYKDSMLLIPGWAADSRIFEPLDIPFNYFFPENISPPVFDEMFIKFTDELRLPRLHLFGWSMGGFIAARLAAKYASMFESVTLVSVRRRYEKEVIERIKGSIRKSRKAYLYKFYEALFAESEEENRRWFKMKLLKRYMAEMSRQVLLEGLDYLSRTELECDGLAGSNVMFVHGDADRIAPIEEIKAVREGLPHAKLMQIHGACHLPFLRKEFTERFSDGFDSARHSP